MRSAFSQSNLSISSLRQWISHSRPSTSSLSHHIRLNPASQIPHRTFAAPAKLKGKGKGAAEPVAVVIDPTAPLDVSFMVVAKGAKPPVIRPDAEYPAWLFDKDMYNPPSLAELRVRSDAGEQLSPELLRRKAKLERKRFIKDKNDSSRKQ